MVGLETLMSVGAVLLSLLPWKHAGSQWVGLALASVADRIRNSDRPVERIMVVSGQWDHGRFVGSVQRSVVDSRGSDWVEGSQG